jgi:serine O-acetyltransferase
LIRQVYEEALESDPSIGLAFRADIVATFDRDPATHRPGAGALFQGSRGADVSAGALALAQSARISPLPAEPLVGGASDRHPSGSADRARYLPRSPPAWSSATAVIEDDVSIRTA